jgi:hypothetical protein
MQFPPLLGVRSEASSAKERDPVEWGLDKGHCLVVAKNSPSPLPSSWILTGPFNPEHLQGSKSKHGSSTDEIARQS